MSTVKYLIQILSIILGFPIYEFPNMSCKTTGHMFSLPVPLSAADILRFAASCTYLVLFPHTLNVCLIFGFNMKSGTFEARDSQGLQNMFHF